MRKRSSSGEAQAGASERAESQETGAPLSERSLAGLYVVPKRMLVVGVPRADASSAARQALSEHAENIAAAANELTRDIERIRDLAEKDELGVDRADLMRPQVIRPD